MEMLPLSDPLKSCVPQHLLRDWSPTNAQLALTGLIEGTPSAMAWEAIVEVLRFWPTPSRLPDACASVISPLQEWPWEWRAISYKRLRQLGLLDLIACTGSLRFEGFEYFGNEVLLLAESPASTSIRQLDFFKIEYTGGAFESLTRSPHLARLSVLRICNAPFFAPLADVLGGTCIQDLQSLVLKGNEIYQETELLGLLDTTLVQRLRCLTISNPCIGPTFLLALVRHPMWSTLTTLDLRGSNVSNQEIDLLLDHGGFVSPKQILIANTFAAKSPRPHWAEWGVDWLTST